MISYGPTEFTGRNWKTGIFGLAMAIPTIIGLIPTLIIRYDGWLIVTLLFGVLILFGIGMAYYSLILKKLIITNLGVQYWVGNTKKFDAAWPSINLITNDSSIVGTAKMGVS